MTCIINNFLVCDDVYILYKNLILTTDPLLYDITYYNDSLPVFVSSFNLFDYNIKDINNSTDNILFDFTIKI